MNLIQSGLHIRVDDKKFGEVLIFKNLCLEVPAGEIVAIVGQSGSGKTTLLRLISGLDNEYVGNISWITPEHSKGKLRIGFLFQDVRLLPWLTIEGNLRFALQDGRNHIQFEVLLNQVGLDGSCLKLYPNQISGGMAKRVGLARALASKPELLLLDEPFSELDSSTKQDVHRRLLDFKSKLPSELTVILVTHDIDEAVFLSDRVFVIGEGRPATLIREVKVDVRRPRKRTDHDYVSLCELLVREIVLDVDKQITNLTL